MKASILQKTVFTSVFYRLQSTRNAKGQKNIFFENSIRRSLIWIWNIFLEALLQFKFFPPIIDASFADEIFWNRPLWFSSLLIDWLEPFSLCPNFCFGVQTLLGLQFRLRFSCSRWLGNIGTHFLGRTRGWNIHNTDRFRFFFDCLSTNGTIWFFRRIIFSNLCIQRIQLVTLQFQSPCQNIIIGFPALNGNLQTFILSFDKIKF